MEENLYAPPQAAVMDVREAQPEFYVVGTRKFLLLFFTTFGLYQLYWSYKHWSRYRAFRQAELWPVARAIFSIFFAHSLNGEIDQSLTRSSTSYRWSPGLLATGYVVFQIVSNVCDRLASRSIGSPVTDLVSIGMLLPLGYVMHRTQQAANLACQQPRGESNRALTAANWIWIVLGSLFWLLASVGWLEMVGVPVFPVEEIE